MAKKILLIIGLLLIVAIAGGSFYGGMKYQESKMLKGFTARNFSNIQNGTRGQNGSNFLNGEIISKDDKSITVKLQNGSSKIVFYSESTEISKFSAGTATDLEIGKTISISGKTNQDGSITAQSIQLRPEGANTNRPQ